MTYRPNREEALEVLYEYTKTPNLREHAYAVEAVMLHFAELAGVEDAEQWGVIGLIHDLDYEQYPDRHCEMTAQILEEKNWPQEYIRAAVSHGWGICTDVEPKTDLEKTLYAVDELTGLVLATALMRPSRSLNDLEVRSVKKKWKQKSFAAGVNREVIQKGSERLGMELDELIRETIEGMKPVAEKIGLNG